MFNKISQIARKLMHNSKGQSATEYMLILAVVVLTLVAAASKLIPYFETGVKQLGSNITKDLQKDHPMTDMGGN